MVDGLVVQLTEATVEDLGLAAAALEAYRASLLPLLEGQVHNGAAVV